jgi:hypothetical protein
MQRNSTLRDLLGQDMQRNSTLRDLLGQDMQRRLSRLKFAEDFSDSSNREQRESEVYSIDNDLLQFIVFNLITLVLLINTTITWPVSESAT